MEEQSIARGARGKRGQRATYVGGRKHPGEMGGVEKSIRKATAGAIGN